MKPQTSTQFELVGLLKAWESGHTSETVTHLSELAGWDEGKVEIVTVPKLFGPGSYVTEMNLPEREIKLTVFFTLKSGNVRTIKNNIEQAIESMQLVTARRIFPTYAEELAVYIREITNFTQWNNLDAKLELTLLAPNPVKTITT